MTERLIEHPCELCKTQKSCTRHKDCKKYVAWFTQEWRIIREAMEREKGSGSHES